MTKIGPLVSVAIVVVLATVVVIVAGGRLPWSTDPPASTCEIPEHVAGQPGSAAAAPGGGIHVIEQGFTQDPATGAVHLGAVVENTGTTVAYRTIVIFRLFDATHTELSGSGDPLTVEIPIILPGQRNGAGIGTYRASARVTSIEISPGSTTWLPRTPWVLPSPRLPPTTCAPPASIPESPPASTSTTQRHRQTAGP